VVDRRERAARIGRIVGGVLRQVAADAGAPGIVVLEDWTPEGELTYEWAVRALGEHSVWRAAAGAIGLAALPASKTVLLLAPTQNAPLLPLGDLYASQVEELTGRWSAPPNIEALAERAGGIHALDAALQRWLEERQALADALRPLGEELAEAVGLQLRRARSARWHTGIVPKLGTCTLGIDLYV
jgi:hypothetical protein